MTQWECLCQGAEQKARGKNGAEQALCVKPGKGRVRITGAAAEKPGHKRSAERAEAEARQTEHEHSRRFPGQHAAAVCCQTEAEALKDQGNMEKFLPDCLTQALGDAADAQKVSEHQTSDERAGRGKQERDENGAQNREKYKLCLACFRRLLHRGSVRREPR